MSTKNTTAPEPRFSHRSCYVNFAEHLQNRWNPNVLYPGAANQWSAADWKSFLTMLRAFGFNCFEYWLVPALFDPAVLEGETFSATMRQVHETAHALGL